MKILVIVNSGDGFIIVVGNLGVCGKIFGFLGAKVVNIVIDNNITALKKLLNSDAEIDHKNYRGQTPLHLAVKTNNIEIVEILIDYHATISIFDVYNFSPLYYANNLKYFDLANLLKQNGAKIEVRKINQKSGLDSFIRKYNCQW